MKCHAFAELFPPYSDQELADLAADIRQHGQRDPIVTLKGMILDGRNRFTACQKAGVKPRFEEYDGNDPLAFVLSKNLRRRHLTEGQRGIIANKVANLKPGDNQHTKGEVSTICLTSNAGKQGENASGGMTQAEAAAALNVSTGTVKKAKVVIENAVAELVELVESGKVALDAACLLAGLPEAEQRKLVKAGPKAIKERAAEIRQAKKGKTKPRKDTPKPPETPAGPSDDKPSNEPVTVSVGTAPVTPPTPPEPPAQQPKPPEPDETEEVPELKKLLSQLKKYIKANLSDAAEISHKIGQVIDYITDMEAEMKPEETRPCYPQISHFNNPKVIGPKKYQSKSGKGTTILDAFGIPVQSQYADQFCERRYTQIALSISRAINYIEQATTDYEWLRARPLSLPFFPGTEWDKYFTEARQLLIDGHMEWANNALPWCVCRGCNGVPPRCKACRFTGIWGRDAVGAFPEIMAKASKTGTK